MLLILKYNLRNLARRRKDARATVLGVALVVAVLVAVLALAEGLEVTLRASGSPETILMLRVGANSEDKSSVSHEAARIIATLEQIAHGPDGQPLVAPEAVVPFTLYKRGDHARSNVVMRGISPLSREFRPGWRLVEGAEPRPGLREVMVGRRIAERFDDTDLGATIRRGAMEWKVVGIFEAGGTAFDSEMWAPVDEVLAAFGRDAYSSVRVRVRSADDVEALAREAADDRRLVLKAMTEQAYFEEQTIVAAPIRALGYFLSILMAVGAAFGIANSMYAAVASRAREIGTLRALGFRRTTILLSFAFESALLAAVGGAVGCAVAWWLDGVATGTTNWFTFSELAFSFRVTAGIAVQALVFAAAIGAAGGFFPALAAARRPIVESLRGA